MNVTEKQIMDKLDEVFDPELHVSIVDLGLIYKVTIDEKVTITMTLTTIGCPLSATIEADVKGKMKELGVDESKVIVDITFDPPWSMDKMSENAKATLGIE